MRDWSKPAITLLFGFGLLLACTFVYLSKVPLNFTYDGMVFASHIERDHEPLWNFFHPHHLIYTFLGRLLFLWGRDHGASWDGLVTLQFFDLVTGVLGVLLVFHLLVRETDDRPTAFLSALGLSLTYSYWYFSTSPGVRIFATVTPLLAWYVLTYQRKAHPTFGLVIGFAHAFACLGHQTNLLLFPAFLIGILSLPGRTFREKFQTILYYSFSLTFWVLAVYGFVGRFICYRKTYSTWLWWVFSYFHVQQWGGHMEQAGIERGKFAMVQAFLQDILPYKTMAEPFTYAATRTIFTYTLWFLTAYLLLRIKPIWTKSRMSLIMAFLWLLAFVPFFIWWEPWNIEFWVSSTVPCWILLGLVVSDLSRLFKLPVLSLANRALIVGLWGGIIVLMFFYNFQDVLARNTVKPAMGHQNLLGALDWKVPVDDLLIVNGINTIPFYIDRFQKRRTFSLYGFFRKYRSHDQDVGKTPPDPWKGLDTRLHEEWKQGHKVWVLTEAVDPTDEWRGKLERMLGFQAGSVSTYFGHYNLEKVEYHGKVYFYEVRSPSIGSKP